MNDNKNQCKKMIIFSSIENKKNIDSIIKVLSDVSHISESKIVEKSLMNYLLSENEYIQELIIELYNTPKINLNEYMKKIYEYIYKYPDTLKYKNLLNCHINFLNNEKIIYKNFYTEYLIDSLKDLLNYLKERQKKTYSSNDYDTPCKQLELLFNYIELKEEIEIRELFNYFYIYNDLFQTQKYIINLLSYLSMMCNDIVITDKQKYYLHNELLKLF